MVDGEGELAQRVMDLLREMLQLVELGQLAVGPGEVDEMHASLEILEGWRAGTGPVGHR